ncbi:MAG: hypothetical protein ACOY3P_12255 [Planctomycetota bacterium]
MTKRLSTSSRREAAKRWFPHLEVRPSTYQSDIIGPGAGVASVLALVRTELKAHAPFTLLGALTGVVIMVAFVVLGLPRSVSVVLFWSLHPLHVLLSALVTTAMFTLHSRRTLLRTVVVGYIGSVGIATVSDCVIPYLAETLLNLPNRGIHPGFIEKWWLVNPLAAVGIVVGYFWPRTGIPHAAHVLLSTWASLFHITMAIGGNMDIAGYAAVTLFLFLAVWVPCCTSDIVFPLLFTKKQSHLPC